MNFKIFRRMSNNEGMLELNMWGPPVEYGRKQELKSERELIREPTRANKRAKEADKRAKKRSRERHP